jgi:hypothetical protein
MPSLVDLFEERTVCCLGLEVLGTSEIKTSRVIIWIQQDAVTEWLLRLVSKTNAKDADFI